MARRVIGLDLGAYSVKLVRLECGKQNIKFEILTVVEEILPIDNVDGEVTDLSDKHREAILRLHQQGFLDAETYAIGLAASEGQMRTMRVPLLDNRKIEAVLPGLLESEVPFDVDSMITSWHRIEHDTESTPNDAAEGMNIRLAFGKKLSIARTLQILQPSSVDPRIMHLSAAAPYELVRELGFSALERVDVSGNEVTDHKRLVIIIDFGHRATNLCIFDHSGIKLTRSFLKGGADLNEAIAKSLEVAIGEAVDFKHHKLDLVTPPIDELADRLQKLGRAHFDEIFDEISRTIIATRTSGIGDVVSVATIGGACLTGNFSTYFERKFSELGVYVVPLVNLLPINAPSPNTALALAYALSGIQLHAKDSRFNFRKDEFAWRGELDFMRSKSGPLILWTLIIVCSLAVLWSASSLVLDKENQYIESRLKNACSQILGQKNVAPKKCLALMKEQISSNIDLGIPEFTAADVYLKTAENLPKELNITFSELDATEKKVRINADTGSFEEIDKVVANLSKIPCFANVEKGRAQQVGNVVKFSLSSDLNCNAAPAKVEPAKSTP